MENQKKFNKLEYDRNYQAKRRKEKSISRVVIDLDSKEKEYVKQVLNKHNLSYKQFFMNAIEDLKNRKT